MAQYVYGLLHGVDDKKRVIAIKDKNKVRFYYMAKGLFQSFMQYFRSGIYVFLYVSEESRRYRGYTVNNVMSIEKVLAPHKQTPTIYYDVNIIKAGISSIVNSSKNKCFLDFEMSMPPYRNYNNFVSEIIQVGFVLTDQFGNVIQRETYFIKSILYNEISDRTKKFLHIEQSDIDGGIPYPVFYERFITMLNQYKPMIFVWGQNDQLELRKMNNLHSLTDFTPKTQFVDLLKLHKTYYGLKNDLGLFNAFNLYKEVDLDKQMHDALEDAMITKEVFFSFVEVCNGKSTVKLDENLIDK